MALVAIAGWAVGGALVSLLQKGSSHRQDEAEGDDATQLSPRTPRSETSEAVCQWLRARATPPSSAAYKSSKPRDGFSPAILGCTLTQRPLVLGTLVCLTSMAGELLVVKQTDKGWNLRPVPTTFQEGPSLSFFPSSSLFIVIKDGQQVGFKSYSANGCNLQAVKGEGEQHRLANQKFGSWERWNLTPEGYVNQQWGKKLGYEIKELRCVLVKDMRRLERRHLQEKNSLEEQAQFMSMRQRLCEDENAILQDVAAQRTWEGDDARQRIGELQWLCDKYKLEAAQKSAFISQLERKVQGHDAEMQRLTSALKKAKCNSASAEAHLTAVKRQAEKERFLQDQAHARELHSMHTQNTEALDRADAASRQKDIAMASILEQLEQGIVHQAEKINFICAERDRLDVALQSISRQMEASPLPLGGACSEPTAADANSIRELRIALLSTCSSPGPGEPGTDSSHDTFAAGKIGEAQSQQAMEDDSTCEASCTTMCPAEVPDSGHQPAPYPQSNPDQAALPLAISLGSKKLLQLLGHEDPWMAGNIRTPRVMTPHTVSSTGVQEKGEIQSQQDH